MTLDFSRRRLLAAALLGGAAAGAARAQSPKVSKAAASYQFTPKGGERCGACASFAPGSAPDKPGACEVVEGAIPPNGWCVLFSPRRR